MNFLIQAQPGCWKENQGATWASLHLPQTHASSTHSLPCWRQSGIWSWPAAWNKKQSEPWGSGSDQRAPHVCKPSLSAPSRGGKGMAPNPELDAAPSQGSPGPAPFPQSEGRPCKAKLLDHPPRASKRVTCPNPSLRYICRDLFQSQYCTWSCRSLDQNVTQKDTDTGPGLCKESKGRALRVPSVDGKGETGATTGVSLLSFFIFLHSTKHHVIGYVSLIYHIKSYWNEISMRAEIFVLFDHCYRPASQMMAGT